MNEEASRAHGFNDEKITCNKTLYISHFRMYTFVGRLSRSKIAVQERNLYIDPGNIRSIEVFHNFVRYTLCTCTV